MKSKLIAGAIFTATVATVALFPPHQSSGAITTGHISPLPVAGAVIDPLVAQRPKIEVVFVLDTTSSMSGLIAAAKEKIWSIASTMASAENAPEISMGLVAFRDRGDTYVTRVVDLSDDLDSMYATLMDFQAEGGGDGPESVNQGLYDAVHRISWSQDPQAYKVVFLVGDAPPHMDYANDVPYPQTLAVAAGKGIVVNTVQCGTNGVTTSRWQQMASIGQGQFFQVGQGGDAVAIASPFDSKLAELSARLDATRLSYGDEQEQKKSKNKEEATAKLHALSSVASQARRAMFNASDSGERNLFGDKDLVEDLAAGRVELESIDSASLPASIQALPAPAQQLKLRELADERVELRERIKDLARERTDYLSKKVAETEVGEVSLDHKIYRAIKQQAGKLGLRYEADAPQY